MAANNKRPATARADAPKIALPEPEQLELNVGDKAKRYQLDLKSRWLHDDIKPEVI